MRKLILLLFCIGFLIHANLLAQGLKGFKLPNGLTVYIWEDFTKPDVFGMVGVNVGATADPENLTGLAHYLEHVMFKGTQEIGTINWEKEKPLYEQIIAKYDEMAQANDPVKKEDLSKKINELTIEASKYMVTHEFSGLIEEMGGNGLNAGTSWDYTVYYNYFPSTEVYRWLELNSARFVNPVFRAFQPELETVYEEYNMGQDNSGRQIQDFMLANIFPGHPYSRSVIGLPEHLKNPQLSGLINFYSDWYVPENMVLILVGNVKASQVRGIIQDKFGRLQAKQTPERKQYPEWNIKGRKSVSAKLSPYPQLRLTYQGVPQGHSDEIALDICTSILSNSSQTGLLDKLSLEGDLMDAGATLMSFKEQGRILVIGIPSYDVYQRRFSSLRETEKSILKEIKKLQEGKIEDWPLQSIKNDIIRKFDLEFESSRMKANILMKTFVNNQDIGEVLAYKEKVATITLDEVKAVAKKYFGNDYLALEIQEGKSAKTKKLEKPSYDPITPARNTQSAYAEIFSKLPVMKKEPEFCDFNKIQIKPVNELSKLYYSKNNENDVFTLTLKYGIGTEKMPKLAYAVRLMNNSGIMGLFEPQELKQAFSELGASCHFTVDDSYLYVIMEGYESNLKESCNLLTRQVLMPKLEEKQLNSIIGGQMQNRQMEKEYPETLNNAISQYLFYQDKSDYLDRMSIEEIRGMTVSGLTGEFSRATDYEADIHYVGALPFDDVYEILSANLPLKAQERLTTSPEVKKIVKYAENTIYFLPENDVQQSGIYFLINGKPYDIREKVVINAFNQYFSGSFNGLVMREVREYRSMAYTAYGYLRTPSLQGKDTYLLGYIGTQSDKTINAIEIFLSLLNDMPQHPERMENIKEYLQKTIQISKPDFRNASQKYEEWKMLGYTEDPAKTELPVIDSLTFEDLLKFYQTEIKGKPIAIAIVGDPKFIDIKQLEKFGKVTKVSKSKLFSSK